jgi:enamine deaminase RidA (YjgF/YER057c/UK114 family)
MGMIAPVLDSGPDARVHALGLCLPPAPTPLGPYVPTVAAGGLVFLSGMVPLVDGQPTFVGVVGESIAVEEAIEAARLAAMNALATLRRGLGSLDPVANIARLAVYLRAGADFKEHPRVADGASHLFNNVFGPGHARLVFGVTSLPAGMCVELDVIAWLAATTRAAHERPPK